MLRPEKFGDVPPGLTPYHNDFLRKLKDAVEILVGIQRAQLDAAATPESEAVTFGTLPDTATAEELSYSKVFMHMGSP